MKKKTITVLMVEPHRHPYLKTVEHTLENLQSLVGGFITATYPWEDPVALIAGMSPCMMPVWIGIATSTIITSFAGTSSCVG